MTQTKTATCDRIASLVPITYQRPHIFYPMRKSGDLLYHDAPTTDMNGNLSLPLVMDTEYATVRTNPFKNANRTHITTQIKGIGDSQEVIVQNPALTFQPYPLARYEFHALDYLSQLGYEVSVKPMLPADMYGMNRLQVVMYAFFANAEINMVFSGQMRERILELQRVKDEEGARIEMRRRLATITGTGKRRKDHVALPYCVTVDGIDYALEFCSIDTGAILGMASYKDFCEVAGVKLEAKDNFTSAEKGRMLEMFETRFNDFDSYARGDLYVYEALKGFSKNFADVYKALGVDAYYTGEVALTIGSTVSKLIAARNDKLAGIEAGDKRASREMSENLLKPAAAATLRENPRDTKALLSKVEGGRCTNNRPTTARSYGLNNLLIDLDISGCYGEGQRVQLYPFGLPEVVSYPAKSKVNEYWTLREFLKVYKGELVPGLWFARISTNGALKYAQDYFASWVLPGGHGADLLARYACNRPSDTEAQENEGDETFDEEKGQLKIFLHEIHNGTLTHDGLDFILKTCTPRIRNEFLDGLYIKAAIVYPASLRYDSIESRNEAAKKHKGRNKVRRVKGKLQRHDGEFHGWAAISLAEHYIDDLLANRKLYPKKNADGSKNAMNAAFKLCVNTSYGDMTSKHFELANTTVGNNITARARALAYYMEKGLKGFQTVTDGCVLDPNEVVYPHEGRNLNPSALVDIGVMSIQKAGASRIRLSPIGGYDSIEALWPAFELTVDGETKTKKGVHIRCWKNGAIAFDLAPSVYTDDDGNQQISEPARAWIDAAAMKHLQGVFPGVDVLHAASTSLKVKGKIEGTEQPNVSYAPRVGQFEFEVKDFYLHGTFHGSANYRLVHANHKATKLAMRSYETKKPHQGVMSVDGKPATSDRFEDDNPAEQLHKSLLNNPSKVERSAPFIKHGMVKPGLYKTQQRFQQWDLMPGDDYIKPGMLREFSLSQFKFQSFEQWRAWEKWYSRSKDKYGQSCEEWYLNDDGTLNYQAMIEGIYAAIRSGNASPYDLYRDTERAQKHVKHPGQDDLVELRTTLSPS